MIPAAQPADFEQAVSLAYRNIEAGEVSPGVARLFDTADRAEFGPEAERRIEAAIRSRYQGKPGYRSNWWLAPVPRLAYDSSEFPHLAIEIRRYLVASVLVWLPRGPLTAALIGPMGKPETLTVPMVFLHAILKQDLGRFAVVGRSGSHTTWEIPGAKPVCLPNSFVTGLSDVLSRKSVAAWLEDFGPGGRSVMPLVVGNLLGLEFKGPAGALPLGNQPWTQQQMVDALQGLAYSAKEARDMMNLAAPNLSADLTAEEALRTILQQAGRGG